MPPGEAARKRRDPRESLTKGRFRVRRVLQLPGIRDVEGGAVMGVRKVRKGLLITLGVVLVLVGAMAIASFPGMGAVRRTQVAAVDLSRVADGSYEGAFIAGRFRYAVSVDVKENRITAVSLQDPAKENDVTRAIAAAIMDRQTVVIDAVSGASLTTRAYTRAVEIALTSGAP
jgi:uncharacterized protein with FMN-binding domain